MKGAISTMFIASVLLMGLLMFGCVGPNGNNNVSFNDNNNVASIPGNLHGTITERGGAPLQGVKISIVGDEFKRDVDTDKNGEYNITYIHSGTYAINASKEDYGTMKVLDFTIEDGKTYDWSVAMEYTGNFELKGLHPALMNDSSGTYVAFSFNYSTNQDYVGISITAPDNTSNGVTLSGGENHTSAWMSIPQKGVDYIKMPGKYEMAVETSAWPSRVIFDRNFTFSGANLSIDNITAISWKHMYSCPVHEFWPDMGITVSNHGDLPAYATVIAWLDGKKISFGEYGLGYVGVGEQKVFSKLPFDMVVFKPGGHAVSAELISYIPSGKDAYYQSSANPYPIIAYSEETGSRHLRLASYSGTIQTPANTPAIQTSVDGCCKIAPKYCE